MRRALIFMLGISGLSSVGCGDGPSCPEGTRKVGSQCAPVDGDAGADGGSKQQDTSPSTATAGDAGKDAGRDGKPGHAKADAAVDASPSTSDPTDASVDAEVKSCLIDADHDGYGRPGAPGECALLLTSDGGAGDGGAGTQPGDCADGDPKVHPGVSIDICDRIDNDCDGTIDEGVAETCNGGDDDCDGMVDEDVKNACGGCSMLVHTVGSVCSNGSKGACARAGLWQCSGTDATSCDAPVISPGREVCGDQIDNDCDGQLNESDAFDAKTWYPDCDGDGYTSPVGIKACENPKTSKNPDNDGLTSGEIAACKGYTDQKTAASDCNDSNTAYAPGKGYGYPPTGSKSSDLDCNGAVEKEQGAYVKVGSDNLFLSLCGTTGSKPCACIEWVNVPRGQPDACSTSSSNTHAARVYLSLTSESCDPVTQQLAQRCK